jgi:hypothetical protein
MASPDLLSICVAAFVGVFLLLSILAAIMRLILVVFPEKKAGSDAMVIAAVSTALQSLYPGTRITKVEEIE